MRVGVISDTHSLLRPEALAALRGAEHILHAGDVGDIRILDKLRAIAPVTAIRGNIDSYGACAELPEAEWVNLGGHSLYMIHDVHALDLDPIAAGLAAVISGHSHKPAIEWRGRNDGPRVLFFNPGAAGPRRFSLPISVGFLEIAGDTIQPEIRELDL
jgi:putative phosphoesterase